MKKFRRQIFTDSNGFPTSNPELPTGVENHSAIRNPTQIGVENHSAIRNPTQIGTPFAIEQSHVSMPGGGIASVPAGFKVFDPSSSVHGYKTDPLKSSFVNLPGGGQRRIPPGSKIVPN
uniref:Uncharacterized protein n=1 Tax=Panagrolaimus sp. ES5 TaxID=591445 RepID=A0AC34G0B9_9BILA